AYAHHLKPTTDSRCRPRHSVTPFSLASSPRANEHLVLGDQDCWVSHKINSVRCRPAPRTWSLLLFPLFFSSSTAPPSCLPKALSNFNAGSWSLAAQNPPANPRRHRGRSA